MAIVQKQLGEYLKGEYVKEKGIKVLTIMTVPEDVESEYGVKLECNVTYDGFVKGNPYKWTMNKTSRNILLDKYGNDTAKLLNKKIPIETATTDKGRAIYVDKDALAKLA